MMYIAQKAAVKQICDLPKMGLKMQEMRFLGTYIFKNFRGSMPPDPPSKQDLGLNEHPYLTLTYATDICASAVFFCLI